MSDASGAAAAAAEPPPFVGGSLTDRVHWQLKEDILRVVRRPGEVILEAELAARYGVSKTPVREALRLLANEGWVVVMPRKGYLVRPLQLGDVREVFALRDLLEPAFAADAARRATPEQRRTLHALVTAQAGAPDTESALRSAREFHLALTDILGNTRARRVLSSCLDEIRRLHYLMPSIEEHITSTEELQAHTRILDAFERQDADLAERLMREHLGEVSRALVKAFSGVAPAG